MGRLIQPNRCATISPVLPAGCSLPHPNAPHRSVVARPTRLAAPPVYSLLAFLGLSREHRPSSTEWDEVLAKDNGSLVSSPAGGIIALIPEITNHPLAY